MSFQGNDKKQNKLYSSIENLFNKNDSGSSTKKEENEEENGEREESSLNESSESFLQYESICSQSEFAESLRRRPLHRSRSRESTPIDANLSGSQFSLKVSGKSARDKTSSSRKSSPSPERSTSSQRSVSPLRLSPRQDASPHKKNYKPLYPNLSEIKKSINIEENTNESQSSWIFNVFCLFLAIIVILFAYSFFPLFQDGKKMTEREISIKAVQIEEEIISLQVYFPKQSPDFWNALTAQITSVLLEDEPIEPGTILFVIPNGVEATINCFIKHLMKRLDKIMGTHHDSSTIIDSFDFQNEKPGVGKLKIDEKLKQHFKEGHVVSVIKHIEALKGEDVMIFHGYCDTINAPFKRSIFLLTYHTTTTTIDPSNLHPSIQKHMKHVWVDNLGEDSFASLMTRICNMVVLVIPEPILHCSSN